MPIEFACPSCQKTFRVPDESAGKRAKCPQCATIVQIPGGASGGEPPAPPIPAPPPPEPFPGINVGPPSPQPPSFVAPPASPGEINPYQSPQSIDSPWLSVNDGEIRQSTIAVGEVLEVAWGIFQRNLGNCVLACFVFGIVLFGLSFGLGFAQVATNAVLRIPQDLAIVTELPFQAVGWVIQAWLYAGLASFLLKLSRGEPVEVGEVFAGGQGAFSRLVGPTFAFNFAAFVCGGAIGVSLAMFQAPALAFVVPLVIAMIYVALLFSQYQYLIVDGKAHGFDAFGMSARLLRGNMFNYLLLAIVGFLVLVAGAFVCLIGLLFAMPYCMLLFSTAYLMMTGQMAGKESVPS